MKASLNLSILAMIFAIMCDVETNSTATVLNYTTSIILLPFLALALYARTHPEEFKKFIR